jgi:pyridoxamine 5'-phosphate oxidase
VDSSNHDDSVPRAAMDVSDLRRSATGPALERADLDDDPIVQFGHWFRAACDSDRMDPNAMTLSTVDAGNRPASRTVLLKYFDKRGFVFFTNLDSSKASHIAANANVALLFFWRELGRQIEAKFEELKQKFRDKEVPLPSFWGGYRVIPAEVEFWQGRTNRLHDRFLYTRQDDDRWRIERLAP